MSTIKNNATKSRWLIIQFARFGDLMQASPLINALSRHENAPDIDLLVNEELVSLAEKIIGVQKVWSFQREVWLDLCRRKEASIIDWANTIVSNTREIRQRDYERVINLSHTYESAYIASMMNCPDTVGLVGERDQVNKVGEWERYFHYVLRNRNGNDLNLVDIHKKQLGIGKTYLAPWLKLDEKSVNETARKFPLLEDSRKKTVAIQLGANHRIRRWSIDKWVRVAEQIARKIPVNFTLVGSVKEIPLAQDFQRKFSGKVVNLAGKTSFDELCAVVSRCDLVIGGDTGTLHLAAALAISTLSVFLGMARPEDTAPYGSGRVVFSPMRECYPCAEQSSCSQLKCHDEISVRAVAETALKMLHKEFVDARQEVSYKLGVTSFNEDGCQVFKHVAPVNPLIQKGEYRKVLSNAPAFTIGRVAQ